MPHFKTRSVYQALQQATIQQRSQQCNMKHKNVHFIQAGSQQLHSREPG